MFFFVISASHDSAQPWCLKKTQVALPGCTTSVTHATWTAFCRPSATCANFGSACWATKRQHLFMRRTGRTNLPEQRQLSWRAKSCLFRDSGRSVSAEKLNRALTRHPSCRWVSFPVRGLPPFRPFACAVPRCKRKKSLNPVYYFLFTMMNSVTSIVRPPAMTRKGMANIAAAEHASLGGKPVLTRKQLNSTQNVV